MNRNIESIKDQYPEGTRIRLSHMKGEPQMPAGLCGIVTAVDGIGQVHVSWENGSSLALDVVKDDFEIIKDPISVLFIEPGKKPILKEIEPTLDSMQNIVGGLIEESLPFEDEVAIVCNEEGKISGLPLNRSIRNLDGEIIDIIAGTFFLAYAPMDAENFMSLPEELAEKYMNYFKQPEKFFYRGGSLQVVKCRDEE